MVTVVAVVGVVAGVVDGSLGVGVDGADGVGVAPSSCKAFRFFCRLCICSLMPSSMDVMSEAWL